MNRRIVAILVSLCFILASAPSHAQSGDVIVEKKTFELPSYTTVAGGTIKTVKIGWEAVGTLNADKSNAILVTHFFSGTSHAFGKYASADPAAGYWDAIIGPGKAIDTNKYYVLSSDTLVNLNAKLTNVVTTGPASINPDTGKPYGMSFPVVSIADFVRVQKALIDSLGIKKLKAVMGASMGGLQAYEWAASYPASVERIIPVIASAGAEPFLIAWIDIWGAADPARSEMERRRLLRQGAAARGPQGRAQDRHASSQQLGMGAQGFWNRARGRRQGAGQGDANKFKIEAFLEQAAAGRAAVADANHFLYLCQANQLASVDPAKIKVPALVLYAPNDLVFYEPDVQETIQRIAAAGTSVESGTLVGPNGHINAFTQITQRAGQIAAFLAK